MSILKERIEDLLLKGRSHRSITLETGATPRLVQEVHFKLQEVEKGKLNVQESAVGHYWVTEKEMVIPEYDGNNLSAKEQKLWVKRLPDKYKIPNRYELRRKQ